MFGVNMPPEPDEASLLAELHALQGGPPQRAAQPRGRKPDKNMSLDAILKQSEALINDEDIGLLLHNLDI